MDQAEAAVGREVRQRGALLDCRQQEWEAYENHDLIRFEPRWARGPH